MKLMRRHLLLAASGVVLFGFSTTAFARTTVVQVELWDKGAMSMNMMGKGQPMGMSMGVGSGMPHRGKQAGMGPMGVRLSKATVPAGDVTFNVTNASKVLMHEMVISPVADLKQPLPYLKDANKVDEDAAGHLAEVADLEAGKNGSVTVNLKPGTYMLYCNIPGHYVLGMWSLLTVK